MTLIWWYLYKFLYFFQFNLQVNQIYGDSGLGAVENVIKISLNTWHSCTLAGLNQYLIWLRQQLLLRDFQSFVDCGQMNQQEAEKLEKNSEKLCKLEQNKSAESKLH